LITGKTKEPYLGILLTYSENPDLSRKVFVNTSLPAFCLLPTNSSVPPSSISHLSSGIADPSPSAPCAMPVSTHLTPCASRLAPVRIGLLGAGEFAKGTLLPAMKKVKGIEFVGVCTASGVSSQHVAHKFDFDYATTDEGQILDDPKINTIVVATRHHLHARQVIAALKAGKHVFVEKPLCINEAELKEIIDVYHSTLSARPSGLVLMVGYNRRFSPMARKLKEFLADIHEPLVMNYRVNAGYVPPEHWVHDPEQGGGRIIGEVCHFVDFLTFLAGALPQKVYARTLTNNGRYRNDNLTITIEFANGSLGTITYVANGDKSFSKEHVEVFGGGAAALLENFRRLEVSQNGRRQVVKSWIRQDKGHYGEWDSFVKATNGDNSVIIPFKEITSVTLTSFCLIHSLDNTRPIEVPIP